MTMQNYHKNGLHIMETLLTVDDLKSDSNRLEIRQWIYYKSGTLMAGDASNGMTLEVKLL